MSASSARELLARAEREENRPRRHLLVAAAIDATVEHRPVVVGGAAEDHYTSGAYIETDLDLVGWLTPADTRALQVLGFLRDGRHLVHAATSVAVEFPESRLDGDEARIVRLRIGGGEVSIIGVDDLYLDRIRQATAERPPEPSGASALAIGVANVDVIDWGYITSVIDATVRDDPALGTPMRAIERRVRRRMRRTLRDHG